MNGRHAILSMARVAKPLALLLVLWLPLGAGAHPRYQAADVTVEVVGSDGRRFATYPVRSESYDVRRAWLEARHREPYRIRVHNRSGERVGLVIAVDGRNIISGARSELMPDERMYVLEPWAGAEYEGWRTSSERVNEFYFTDWPDSYAEAFGDRSARGVIAVAVYGERHAREWKFPWFDRDARSDSGGGYDRDGGAREEGEAAPPASAAPSVPGDPGRGSSDVARSGETQERSGGAQKRSRADSSAGTGFGDEIRSPVRVVQFDAKRQPAARHFIKYEWRDTLCRKAVIACDGTESNRFWNEERFGYAPYPPGR